MKRSCCRVYSIVTVDSKGQIVLPKEVREEFNIGQNDRLVLIGFGSEKDHCCMVIMKADRLNSTLASMLQPIFKEVIE
ncbi:AbrB/MazE/SpoVT family DNA-binding domain-containing protein [Candidatus Bathyarchaeota archaeon]|nr:AbrB/MazE/SpoVT family DNA-binding domain-containing protein [Candidatus Bathyarchaeota archaeon]